MSDKIAHGKARTSYFGPHIWFDVPLLRETANFDEGDKVVVILESEYERLKALESPTT